MRNSTFWFLWLSLAVVAPPPVGATSLNIAPAGTKGSTGAEEREERALELLARGQAALLQNDLLRADRAFRHALELSPALHEARQGYASSLVASGRPMRAVSLLQNGLSIEPGHVPTIVQLAGIAADSGAHTTAIEAIESVPASAFESLDALALDGWLAALYLAAGQYTEALSRYSRLCQDEPDMLHWLAGKAVSAEMVGRPLEARATWEKVAELEVASRAVIDFAAAQVQRLDGGSVEGTNQ